MAGYLVVPFQSARCDGDASWPSAIVRAVFVAAIPEETAKVALIALLVMRLRYAHEPSDGWFTVLRVGLGFAAWENLGTSPARPDDWELVALARSVLTVPFHAALGRSPGLSGGGAVFRRPGRSSARGSVHLREMGLAWLVPIALHAARTSRAGIEPKGAWQRGGRASAQVSVLSIGFGAIVVAVLLALRPCRAPEFCPACIRVTAGWRGVVALVTWAAPMPKCACSLRLAGAIGHGSPRHTDLIPAATAGIARRAPSGLHWSPAASAPGSSEACNQRVASRGIQNSCRSENFIRLFCLVRYCAAPTFGPPQGGPS